MLRAVGSSAADLSKRERLVARKFADGMTYRQIGESLFIAPTTVRSHLAAIYRKLGVHNKIALSDLLSIQRDAGDILTPVSAQPNEDLGRPVIAVIPIENLSGDEFWTRLADGLSADIIGDLARYPDLSLIARQTMACYKGRREDVRSIGRELNADYVLEGTVQVAGEVVRIAVQLVDARTELALWTSRYERSAEDLFAMQDSITENVVNVLASWRGKIASFGCIAARRKHPGNLRAYDCYLLGVEACHKLTPDSNRDAIRLQSRAVELDPDLARAWAALGMAYSVQVMNSHSSDQAEARDRWRTCIEKALELDPSASMAHISLGELRALEGDLTACEQENAQALALAPNDADTLAKLAGSRALVVGDSLQGYELARRAIQLNPHATWYNCMLGRCSFVVGRYRECVTSLEQIARDAPATLLFLAMAHAMLDEREQVAAAVDQLAGHFPEFTVDTFIGAYPVTNPPALIAIHEASRRAGLA
jgi:TolB-like protein/DNA-binding CsgD family transcriptional regulator